MGDPARHAHEGDVRVAIVALLERDVHIRDLLPPLSDVCALLDGCYGAGFWINYGADMKAQIISETVLKCSHINRLTPHRNVPLDHLGTLLRYLDHVPSSSFCSFSASDLEDIMRIIPSFAAEERAVHMNDDGFSGCVDSLKSQCEALDADLALLNAEGAGLDNRLQKTFVDIKSVVASASSSASGRNLKYLELLQSGDFDHIFGLLRKDIADSELSVGFERTPENDDSDMSGVFSFLLERQLELYDVFTQEVFDEMRGGLCKVAGGGGAIPEAFSIEEKIKAVNGAVSSCKQSFDKRLQEFKAKHSDEMEGKLAALRTMYQRHSASYAESSELASSMWLEDLKRQKTKTDVYGEVLEQSLSKFLGESKGIVMEYHDVLQKAKTVIMHRSAEVAQRGKSYGDVYETPKTSMKVLKKTKIVDDMTKEHSRLLREEAARGGGRADGRAGAEERRGLEPLEGASGSFDDVAIEEAHKQRLTTDWA